ncbi:MAG: translocation/assembly module TamB [Muribaculaceae bacterium]|nr:translocation/assembly module TamB [Muribaculaceae bacterium]
MHFVRKILKCLLLLLTGLVLLGAGVALMLYSPWTQETLRRALVEHFGPGSDTELHIRSLSLRPPLRLRAGGVAMVQNGDSIMAADSLTADVAVLPLLSGKVRLDNVELRDGFYCQGGPDSAMYMTLRAGLARLNPASVNLSTMDIDVEDATLSHCRMNLLMNPDTTTTPTPADTATMAMRIALRRVAVDNLHFQMRMLPTIDSLGAYIAAATLRDGNIDMGSQLIELRELAGTGLSASYIAPDSATIAATPVVPESESTSPPWTVKIRDISFDNGNALYTTRGLEPQPGLDFGYIALDSVRMQIHDFFNRATTVEVPLLISGRERCGVDLSTRGTLLVDSVSLRLDSFALSTPYSALEFNYMMGMGDITTDPTLPLAVDAKGRVGRPDAQMMFPAFGPMLAGLPESGIRLDIDAAGTWGDIDLRRGVVEANNCVRVEASGSIQNAMQPELLGADIDLRGNISNVAPIAATMLSPETMKSVRIPHMTLWGNVRMRNGNNVAARLTARTDSGTVALDGAYNMSGEAYRAEVTAKSFPVNAFMPLLGVGRVTATLDASGHGMDFLSPKTAMTAHADVASAQYGGHDYTNIVADVTIAEGQGHISVNSADPAMLADLTASGNLSGDELRWDIYTDAHRLDLKTLKFSDTENTIAARLSGNVGYGMNTGYISGALNIDRLQMRSETSEFDISDVRTVFAADSTISATMTNRDLLGRLDINCNLDTLMARTDSISAAIDAMMAQKRLDPVRLQRAVPQMSLQLAGGSDNMVNDILSAQKMSVDSLSLSLTNEGNLGLSGKVLGVHTESMRLDTIGMSIVQFGSNVLLNANVDNRPGTMDSFAHVQLSGLADANVAGLRIRQQNIERVTGYDLGLQAQMSDSIVSLSIMPLDPTIGYKPWTVNAGNFISYAFSDGHVDADIHMSGDNSSLNIFTEHEEHEEGEEHHHEQEDLIVQIGDVHIQDWISLNPFAPPIRGDVSAEVRLNYNDARQLNGRGSIDLTNFFYDGEAVAHMRAEGNVSTAPGGALIADADVSFDGHKAITLRGALNDSTLVSPMNLDLRVISLPLSVVNPFLGADMGRLSGTLNGSIDLQGTSEKPTMNGWLALDSASVFLAMTATDYPVTTDTVPVVNNYITLRNFEIYGTNKNPLSINGDVDITNMFSPSMDINMKANDMQIVNSRRAARGADIYGKAFISLDATAKGNMSFMRVNADLKVLSGTNVTYIMPDAVAALQAQNNDQMVKFVNLTDSTAVANADSLTNSSMAMLINANLTFETNAIVGVDLSTDGKNRAQVQPVGELTYAQTPMSSDGRVTGRLNIEGGYVRYTPPFMSEKNFKFKPDSYVAFNGDMMNPTLNIQAVDVMKANVTQTGQNSRLVNFDVGLSVTGTLEQMKVAFDLSTDDDITVSNELQAMSPEQRANQAMNMLLYNIYTGPGTRGDSNIGGNFLFSFLESKINSWAANNIKGVDISFGIDQYDRTVDGNTSATTSYSYQVSKSLFNDRFKIVVGGNYSTDANADENFSQNLINDISFEYFLNRAQTMYFRLFRHTGYESILEGEITKTGVGFVYKHKMTTLRDLFPRRKRQQ